MNEDPYQEATPKNESGTGLRLLITIGGLLFTVVGAVVLAFNLLSNYRGGDDSRTDKPARVTKAPSTSPDDPGSMVGQNDPPPAPGDLPTGDGPDRPSAGTAEVREGDLAGKYVNVVRIRTRYNYSWFVGMYKNTGSGTLRKPRLELEFLDADGNVVPTSRKLYAYGARGRIEPGESVPFRIRVSNVPEHSSWRILHQPKRPFSKRARLKLKISNTRIGEKDRYGAYSVTGTIINKDENIASLIKLIALMYDGSGQITGHSTYYLQKKRLNPGESAQFEFRVRHVKNPPVKLVMDYTGWVYRGSSRSKSGGSSAWPE